MTWIIRIIIIVLIIRALLRFVSGLVEGTRQARPRVPSERGVPLVRDPVCGTYVVQSRALTMKSGDRIHYFCSEQCRRTYHASR